MQRKGFFLSVLGLLVGSTMAQGYLNGKPILELANAGRYEEAYQLTQKQPELYAQWASFLIWQSLLPNTYGLSPYEATIRAFGEACKHKQVNKESEAFCYRGILSVRSWENQGVAGVSDLARAAGVPSMSAKDAQRELERLEKEGVPYAVVYNQAIRPYEGSIPMWAMAQKWEKSDAMRAIAQQYPYSLGGVVARGMLAAWVYWVNGRYREALDFAKDSAGIFYPSAGVVAWAEYTGTGVRQDKESACRRALFWTNRIGSPATTYTLGLCYLEGAGGFPKDPVEAYALFWMGKEVYQVDPFASMLKDLEAKLSPQDQAEGRRRANKYIR